VLSQVIDRHNKERLMKRILVPTDFSPHSEAALAMARDLAGRYGAHVTLLHVCPLPLPVYEGGGGTSPDQLEQLVEEAGQALARTRTRVGADGAELDTVVSIGDVPDEILRHASEQGCDLIVIGTHGRRGLRRLMLGSVAEQLVRRAEVPVLTTRGLVAVAAAATPAAVG
jgi:nucleotide-binding universal stress UspA family protein